MADADYTYSLTIAPRIPIRIRYGHGNMTVGVGKLELDDYDIGEEITIKPIFGNGKGDVVSVWDGILPDEVIDAINRFVNEIASRFDDRTHILPDEDIH